LVLDEVAIRMFDIDEIFVTKQQSIKDAFEKLNQTGSAGLLLINEEGKLLRTITDGDLRRLLLKEGNIEVALANMISKIPITLGPEATDQEIIEVLDKAELDFLVIVDQYNVPIRLVARRDVSSKIWLSEPHLSGKEIDYIKEALDSNWLAPMGPNNSGFERDVVDYLAKDLDAIAVNSGTAAIHLALIGIGVKMGDIVLCSSLTFAGSAFPIVYQNALPVFIDCDQSTWNMCPNSLELAIKKYILIGKKPKAIIVVDLFGMSADYEKIIDIANAYDIPIVEDAAESLGSTYQGNKCGSFGEFGIFSFNGNKIITTSGGGMLICRNQDKVKYLRKVASQSREPVVHYEHKEVGYNYLMSNVLAGVGRAQLQCLDDRIRVKRDIFRRYKELLSDIPGLQFQAEPVGSASNRWLTAIRLLNLVDFKKITEIVSELRAFEIDTRPIWKPMHLQPFFHQAELVSAQKKPICEDIFNSGLCLPSTTKLTASQQENVVERLDKLIRDRI
jgi:dTDP-4-amino-4,6-dideoxygalactose transaminase/CBS domain-containing protein